MISSLPFVNTERLAACSRLTSSSVIQAPTINGPPCHLAVEVRPTFRRVKCPQKYLNLAAKLRSEGFYENQHNNFDCYDLGHDVDSALWHCSLYSVFTFPVAGLFVFNALRITIPLLLY